MANEITVFIKSALANGDLKINFGPGQKKFDQSAALRYANTIALTTNSTALALGAVDGQAGWCFLTNTSTANECVIGPTSSSPFVRVPASGHGAFMLVGDTTIAGKTLTGTANLDYEVWST